MKDSAYKNKGRQIPLLAWSSDFCFVKKGRYICRLILGGLALWILMIIK